jgi:hypothetical protein
MKTKKFLILSICLLFIGNVSVSADNNNGSNRRDIPLSNEGKYEEMSLVTRQWSVPKSGFCNKVKASESVTGTCWEIVVRPAK